MSAEVVKSLPGKFHLILPQISERWLSMKEETTKKNIYKKQVNLGFILQNEFPT